MTDKIVNATKICKIMGFSESTLMQAIFTEGFPAEKEGGQWVASRKKIEEWAGAKKAVEEAEKADEQEIDIPKAKKSKTSKK